MKIARHFSGGEGAVTMAVRQGRLKFVMNFQASLRDASGLSITRRSKRRAIFRPASGRLPSKLTKRYI